MNSRMAHVVFTFWRQQPIRKMKQRYNMVV